MIRKVWIALARTESADTYVYVFNEEPDIESVVWLVMEWEGAGEEEFDYYYDTTNIERWCDAIRS